MAKIFNRAKMTTSTTGTGTITLGSASSSYQSFADAGVSDGDVVQYVIEEGSNFEIGTGTYTASGTTLSRTVEESSNSDALISLGGAANVSITAVAAHIGGGNRDLSFDDNAKAKFGAGNDLQIYHDGTNTQIDNNTGTLIVRSAGAGTIEFRDQSSQVLAQFNDNADVKLYYNNSAKLATTSTGIDVTGEITFDGGTTSKALRHDQDTVSATGGTLTIDLSNANNFLVNISANTTFAFSNKDAGRFGNIIIKQDATGGYSFTLPAECKTPVNGASIVQSTGANEVSILAYYVLDSSNILVNYIGDFA
jgi:hypothetical protein